MLKGKAFAGKNALTIGASLALGVGLSAAIWAGMKAYDRHQAADTVVNVVWVDTPGGPRLLLHEQLHRSGETSSWVVNRAGSLDPSTGAKAGSWMLGDEDGSGGGCRRNDLL